MNPQPTPAAPAALDLDRLREVAAAATPGDWHWAGNTDTGEPYLATWSPNVGRTSILAIGWENRSTTGRDADRVRSEATEYDLGDPDEVLEDWAFDRHGTPVREPRLWFYRDHMAVDARSHVTYEVAPQATSREDPKVYRADITDVRLPDAQYMTTFSPATVTALLDEVARLRGLVGEGTDD
jgi:hypothetical protein